MSENDGMRPAGAARRLIRFLRPLWPTMALSALLRVLNQALGVALPALGMATVVEAITGGRAVSLLWWLFAAALAKGLFRYLEQFTGHKVAFHLLSLLRSTFYRRIEPLIPGSLPGARSGELVARVTADVERIEPFYAHTIAPLVSAVLVPALVAAALAVVDPRLTLVLLPFLAFALLVTPFLYHHRSAAAAAAVRSRSGLLAAELTETVQGVREVLAFEAEEARLERLAQIGEEMASARRIGSRATAFRAGISEAASMGALLTVALVGAGLFQGGDIGPVGFSVAIALTLGVFNPLRAVEELLPDLDDALAAASRLFQVMETPPAVVDLPVPVPASGRGGFSFEEVTFSYPGRAPALQQVTLEVEEGERVAVVGATGSGKSTLIALLLRWWDPQEGAVTVGGVEVRRMRQADLRAQLAVAEQRPHLFVGTIAGNVRLAAPSATDDEVEEVLRRLGLGAMLDAAPEGLDTQVGELGMALSGGQRQRLALARALLRPSPILVLDEATSELDVDTESEVLESVFDAAAGRTLLMVAHRLRGVVRADRIVVIERGRVVEQGSHASLLAAGGVYASLWSREADALVEA